MRHSGDGFTLTEVMVAIALMALVLTGIASMGITTISSDTYSSRESAATALAQAKLEELRLLRRAHADWAAGVHSQTGLAEDGQLDGGPYDREWRVETDYNGFPNLSRVTVTVSWADGEVSLSSLYW